MKRILIGGVLAVAIAVPAALFFLSAGSRIEMGDGVAVLGAANRLVVKVSNPHGVRSLRVRLEQESAISTTAVSAPDDRWLFWRKNEPPRTFEVQLTADPRQGFRSGPAKLVVEAVSNDFRNRTDRWEREVQVNLAPPGLSVGGEIAYLNQGGAGLVRFTVKGYWTEAGVRVGKEEFRSYPAPGGSGAEDRFSLFVFPWDASAGDKPVVFARNPGGQQVTAEIPHKLFPKAWRRRDLPLTDAFLEKVVPRLDAKGQGPLLERFLHINREVRRANNQTLADLRLQTVERQLWEGPFEQMASTKVEALFADIRSYVYQGRKVDEQTHLGFDLSRVARAPVGAANHGKVIFAGELGIYGNCVVVDHGYGIQTIYAHLTDIGVEVGREVKRGEVLGRSGETGLAGGDHLHFGMQIDGVQTNPLEWWDPKWVKEKILDRLGGDGAER